MKQFILPLAILLALTLLAGCAAPASGKTEAPAAGEPAETGEAGTVTIRFDGDTVSVQGADEDAVKVDGTAVTVRRSGEYILSGRSDSGSVKVKKETRDVTLVLRGLELTADGAAPICCNKDTAVTIVAEAGTVNTLADTAANNADDNPDNPDAENAVIKGKDGAAVTLSGAGTLNVTANAKNAIKTGGDLTVRELTLNVTAPNDGVKSDTAIVVGAEGEAGPVLTIGGCTEGMEAPQIDVYSGDLRVEATDDGLNAPQGDDGAAIRIHGGRLYADAAEGDGLDSNGEVAVTGGELTVFSSARADNSPLDTGSTFTLSGGTVLAVGAAGMAQSPNETGGQCYLSFGAGGGGFGRNQGGLISIAAGDKIEILDDAGTVLAETEALRAADYVFYSSAALESGRTYTLRVGGEAVLTAAATAEGSSFTGLPDVEGGPGGFGGKGGQRPEGFSGQRPEGMPEMPEGEMPEGFEPPEGFNGERPELPEGMEPPEGFGGRPGGPGGQPPERPGASGENQT